MVAVFGGSLYTLRVKADFDCEGSIVAGKRVPFRQQYCTCPLLLLNWLDGRSTMIGFGLQLSTRLRFGLLVYVTAAGPSKHASISASVVSAPCMTLMNSPSCQSQLRFQWSNRARGLSFVIVTYMYMMRPFNNLAEFFP
jgi:hypothetical protein